MHQGARWQALSAEPGPAQWDFSTCTGPDRTSVGVCRPCKLQYRIPPARWKLPAFSWPPQTLAALPQTHLPRSTLLPAAMWTSRFPPPLRRLQKLT